MSMIELSLLKYFYAVATEGNFTKAARKLFVGQPVVSQMVKNLEDQLGVVLFERQKRQALLTSRGQELFRSCQIIFSEIEAAEQKFKPLSEKTRGQLRMGSIEAVTVSLLPKIHEAFLDQFPLSEIQSTSGPAHFLADLVLKNQIDFAIVGYLFRPNAQLDVEILGQVRHHLVIRRDLYKDPNTWAQLTFISSRIVESDLVDSQPIFQKLQSLIPGINSRLATNNLLVHKSLVLQGKAIASLPGHLIESELAAGELIDLFPDHRLEFPLRLLKRKSFCAGPLEEWYLKSFRRLLGTARS